MFRKIICSMLSAFIILFAQNVMADNFFRLMTSDFSDSGALPATFTCDDENESPEVYFVNLPKNTKKLALIMQDPDAPKGAFFHWVVFNIPTSTKEFPRGISDFPKGTIVGRNDFGNNRYDGPCPPKGSTHAYIFTLYALDSDLNLTKEAKAPDVINAMQNHIIDKAVLTATFGR